MIQQGATRGFFNDLHLMWIEYFLTGGLACDALRGEWTREHKDVDIFVRTRHLSRLLDSLPGDYQAFRKGSIYLLQAPGIEVDILELTEQDNRLVLNGSNAVTTYPAEAFTTYQTGNLWGKPLRVAENEVLVATARYGTKEDQEYLATLPVDPTLVSRIIDTPKEPRECTLERLF